MGQYKVPQNVEAEDKIIGSLTIRQFIYAVIGVGYGLVSYALLKGVPVLFIIVGVPPTILMLLLGLYKRQDQPFDAIFLAAVSYLVKPRHRIWIKEPIAEIFRVEAPVLAPQVHMDDPTKVRGQLEKLAQIVDTRGWSAKQSELQEPHADTVSLADRFAASGGTVATAIQPVEVHASDDILDMQNSPQAHDIGMLIENHAKSVRAEAIKKITDQNLHTQKPEPQAPKAQAPVPANAILKPDYDDLSVAQIAKQVNKQVHLSEGKPVSLREVRPSHV